MKKLKTGIYWGLCLASLAASPGRVHAGEDNDMPPRPNFSLFISNQSFAMSNVDITVSIDNVPVVDDRFPVADQHSWRGFPLSLSNGVHTLVAVTQTGRTNLQTEFTVNSNHSGLLEFWYHPDKSRDGIALTPPSFSFRITQGIGVCID